MIPFKEVELLNSTLRIVPLLGRKVEAPLPAVNEDGEGCPLMETVLEELSIAVVAGVWRFHFDKDSRSACRSEKRIIDSTLINSVLSPNRQRVVNVPAELV